VISATGYLTLPVKKASLANIIGYGMGCAIVFIDLFASSLYPRQATTADLVIATRNLAIFVFLIQLAVLITQSRGLSLTTKISNYFSLFTMIVVATIGFSSIQITQGRILGGTDVTTVAEATLRALERGTTAAGAVVSFVGAILGVLIASTLTNPLSRLTETSAKVASGELDAHARIDTEDEIGMLAGAFNNMTDSLKSMVGQLETRVEERTKDIQRRSNQIQAAAEIGRAAASLLDLENLLTRTTELINEKFGYYHAGVFLLDQAGEYAVLRAANSEGGRKMLERGHRLKVGQTGIVGFVTQFGTARIARDVEQDSVFFDNPDLPETRSEMALPLRASGQILGALDVQSTEPQAFDEEDVATLQILADQLAIAIQNARLLRESQEALEATRIAYGELSREAWTKIIKSQPRVSYVAASLGTVQVSTSVPGTDMIKAIETGDVITSSDGLTIGVPIKIRGRAIGVLRLKKPDSTSAWTHDETTLAISLSEQLSGALESARLYKESQQRAAREALVSDISARIGALPRVESIVRETVQELGEAIGNAKITFSLVDSLENTDQAAGPRGNGHEMTQP
jgi:GAF domain-containing protein/HAMP domain-containing protein